MESSCSANIINNHKLQNLLLTGRPGLELPSKDTIAQDIQASFTYCHTCINQLLKVYSLLYLIACSNISLGVFRKDSFCYRCLDFAKPPCFFGMDSSLGTQW